jgi:hypothetical protein
MANSEIKEGEIFSFVVVKNVSIEEKEEIKEKGAIWYANKKVWLMTSEEYEKFSLKRVKTKTTVEPYSPKTLLVKAPYELAAKIKAIKGASWSVYEKAYIVPNSSKEELDNIISMEI